MPKGVDLQSGIDTKGGSDIMGLPCLVLELQDIFSDILISMWKVNF